jgi:glutathione peroxidase-family protein
MSFYDFTMDAITGESVDFSAYKNQVCLIVNVASA